MLQFWKKSGRNSNKSNSSSPTKSNCSSPSNSYSYKTNNVECVCNGPILSLDDEGLYDIGELDLQKEKSRLTKTLEEVLLDKSALGYYVQYMESRNALSIIRCWLDVENFRAAVQLHSSSDDTTTNGDEKKLDHDSLSVSTDCESCTDSTSYCGGGDVLIADKSNNSENNKSNDCCDQGEKINCDNRNVVVSDIKCNNQQNELDGTVEEEFTEDALTIFKKYVALEATDSVNCPESIRKEIIENICNINRVNSKIFDNVQKFVYDIMNAEYFDGFLGSDYFCKYQIDVLTSGNIVLEDILYNETALFYFMEFLEQENHRNLLEFWLAASNFQQQLNVQKDFFDPIEAQTDAVVLYDKYFSLQAHSPLGFGDKIRFAVEQSICGENGLTLNCFDLPLKIVEQVLEKNHFKSFLTSQLFYKYLSELINTVQSNGYSTMLYEQRRQHSSDCGSERSFSTNSTFLAMENPYNRHRVKIKNTNKTKTTDMNIDTRQLYDPDSLWKRKRYRNRLSFGRVTELGRFETDFEPEPDKNQGSKLRDVVKKFVNLDEDKKKEEMAWQVAEMIVKDITNVTLSDQKY
ncbi:A-kinase anchor protein 10, mitochondrial [Onthophagus taurus]|uniref:A-kinase anchor protein 10, mitochondrial n=1 Tax=Onthophagus taurus TaxID=166361 RepID=UPI000C20B500|nr:A-kinase anchor protein 10, mitochondrial [Onthophagus taurus]